jgi:hypothetical protein
MPPDRPFPEYLKGRPTTGARRPKGLGNATRALVGQDGMALAELWWSIATDPMRRDSDRLEASRLLADRGWGKAASFTPQEGDPLGIEDVGQAAEEFSRNVLRLADAGGAGKPAPADGKPGEAGSVSA